ncbi:choice-of-anchor I family protein [Planctomicrobium piriforme]|uniref:Choice-of-anchor I domain-containing protein n=1 Tax=Planctomicrobium piriforme TaxID=1576369 RepID=A0A1I3N8V3_9PLAN|nr:choice-of-anchor I family protein [Planctomicrobium piriforme]SFJ05668.1 hypothetical protein SAMN05421753_11530 [Planctomicrobium piriforme]
MSLNLFTRMVLLAGVSLGIGCGASSISHSSKKPVSDDAASESVALIQPRETLNLTLLGGYDHGGVAGAEISALDAVSKRLLTVNGVSNAIDIQDLSRPDQPRFVKSVSVDDLGRPTSVVAKHGIIAVSIAAKDKQVTGQVLFLTADGEILKKLEVGYEPDMLTISPDGRWLLTANEAEPLPDYSFDPEGSISMIDLSLGVDGVSQSDVTNVGFQQFNAQRAALDSSIRISGPNATVSQDLEPEYIAVSVDSKTAWITCQENNAVAILDLDRREVTKLAGLGFKDHSQPGNGFDASDKDGGICIGNWPTKGMYQPDGIAAFQIEGQTYLITANEGEHRGYEGFNEQVRVADLQLDPKVFLDAKKLQKSENLGRLKTTNAFGDHNGDGLHEEIYSYGTRSFTIWSADVQKVFDSGDQFDRLTAEQHPALFNSDHEASELDGRSDSKGCEPESVTTGVINGRTYAFVALERISGIAVYDVTNPAEPVFETYFNNRTQDRHGGDLGPEGVLFVTAEASPTGRPLLIVSYEVSGTTRFFDLQSTESAAERTLSAAETESR